MKIKQDIAELLEKGVINRETAEAIAEYYDKKAHLKTNNSSLLVTSFAIIGSLLVGLGIILIVAHNWDQLSKFTKNILSLLPIIIAQALCGYSLLKKDHPAWREASSILLFFGIGASISLISQVYNIIGDLDIFVLMWMLLALPIVYVMKSSSVSLFYILGVTYYASLSGMYGYSSNPPYLYFPLILGIAPHYYQLYKSNPKGNYLYFHNGILPISFLIIVASFSSRNEFILMPLYFNILTLYYFIGVSKHADKMRLNGFKNLGQLGLVFMLLFFSFKFFWESLLFYSFDIEKLFSTLGVYLVLAAFVANLIALLRKGSLLEVIKKEVFLTAFVWLTFIFIIGLYSPISFLLMNALAFTIGLIKVREGSKSEGLAVLNFGLIILSVLIISRFFEADISFFLKGILFIAVGIGFFLANYFTLKRRKGHEQ